MTIDEIISQLEDLRRDRESFLDGDDDEIYQADIEAIDNAINAMGVVTKVAEENTKLKRLLKQSAETIERLETSTQDCKTCARLTLCNAYKDGDDFANCCYKWSGADEAEKLIGGD